MANVPTPELQKLWSNLTESLSLKYENIIQQHPEADVVMELVRGVVVTARLAGSIRASIGAKVRNGL
jgi:hypothetical protein